MARGDEGGTKQKKNKPKRNHSRVHVSHAPRAHEKRPTSDPALQQSVSEPSPPPPTPRTRKPIGPIANNFLESTLDQTSVLPPLEEAKQSRKQACLHQKGQSKKKTQVRQANFHCHAWNSFTARSLDPCLELDVHPCPRDHHRCGTALHEEMLLPAPMMPRPGESVYRINAGGRVGKFRSVVLVISLDGRMVCTTLALGGTQSCERV